jgi:hypothetical protein
MWVDRAAGLGAWRARMSVAFVATFVLGFALHSWEQDLHSRPALAAAYPPLPAEAGYHRLLALPPPSFSPSYRFIRTLPDGSPVAYDPCRPIHYVISSHHLPAYGAKMVREAVAKASTASGLKFVYDGLTTEPLSFQRPSVQRTRYGERWAPVLVGFSDGRETPALAANVMGRGGSEVVAPSGPASARYVTGAVGLDQDDFDQTMTYSNGWAMGRAAVMHELGHVLGLAHVDDDFQLMSPHNSGFVFYGPGDLHGLALEGSGKCHHDT